MVLLNLSYSVVLIALVVFVVVYLVSFKLRPAKGGKALPGPRGLPWLGPVWDIQASFIHHTFHKWGKKFGLVYTVRLLGQDLVIITNHVAATEILAQNGAIVSDRPPLALVEGSRTNGKYLPFMAYGDTFQRTRKFDSTLIKLTHNASYHNRMLPEVIDMLRTLHKTAENPFEVLERTCSRFSGWMAYGTPANHAAITHNGHNLMKNLSPGGRLTNAVDPFRHLPAFLNREKAQEAQRVKNEDRVWADCWEKALSMYDAKTLPNSYVKLYLENKLLQGLNREEAMYAISMLGTVSTLTIIAPVQRWLAAMSQNPGWQTRVQLELDDKIGDRLATSADSAKLPTLRASIVESMRWSSPLPTGIPHRLIEERVWNGYVIPAGSSVIACDWAIARSNELYDAADEFDPARYLDPRSVNYREPLEEYPKLQGQHVFGWGRRTCIGQEWVAAELLTICAAIMFSFNVGLKNNGTTYEQINMENATPHVIPIISNDEGDKLVFSVRSEKRAQVLERIYEAHGNSETE